VADIECWECGRGGRASGAQQNRERGVGRWLGWWRASSLAGGRLHPVGGGTGGHDGYLRVAAGCRRAVVWVLQAAAVASAGCEQRCDARSVFGGQVKCRVGGRVSVWYRDLG
jgi:hypothetical protein